MPVRKSTIAVATSHAKLILVGEHSVVYGHPAIALPFPLGVRVQIEASDVGTQLKSDLYTGEIDAVPNILSGLAATVKGILTSLCQEDDGIRIIIDSDIPIGRGMGSSAAVAVAVVRCLYNYYNNKVSDETLFKWVGIAETYAHGSASGIDMTAVAGDTPIWFEGVNDMYAIDVDEPIYIAVADTGLEGNTRMAVNEVRQRYIASEKEVQEVLDTMGTVARNAKRSLKTGDWILLGDMLDRNHMALRALGVSNAPIEGLIQTAKANGALGAKLTGGGLGGCVLALADTMSSAESIAKAFIAGGAAKSWYFSSHQNTLTTIERLVDQP